MIPSTPYSVSPDAALSPPTIVSSIQPPLDPFITTTSYLTFFHPLRVHPLVFHGFRVVIHAILRPQSCYKAISLDHFWCASLVLPTSPLQIKSLSVPVSRVCTAIPAGRRTCSRLLSTMTSIYIHYRKPQRQLPSLFRLISRLRRWRAAELDFCYCGVSLE